MSKIAITGAATGTATFTIESPATNTNRTLTIPDATTTIVGTDATQTLTNKSMVATQLTGTIAAARLPTGSVLQVVNATHSTTTSNSTSTYADTGLTATITPTSASSKILVLVNQAGCRKEGGNVLNRVQLRLMRTSTEILAFELGGGYAGANSTIGFGSASCCFLDSPATTSATTYKTQLRNGVNAASVSVQTDLEASTITLLEIAA